MTFHKFPLDVQSCKIKFESYGYLSDELNMKWKKYDKCQVSIFFKKAIYNWSRYGCNGPLMELAAGGMGIYSDFTTFFTLIYLK